MNFIDKFVSKEYFYALGYIEETNEKFLSIPVGNNIVDYEENYRLSDQEYNTYLKDMDLCLKLVERCRERLEDYRLFRAPGLNRGTPILPRL